MKKLLNYLFIFTSILILASCSSSKSSSSTSTKTATEGIEIVKSTIYSGDKGTNNCLLVVFKSTSSTTQTNKFASVFSGVGATSNCFYMSRPTPTSGSSSFTGTLESGEKLYYKYFEKLNGSFDGSEYLSIK